MEHPFVYSHPNPCILSVFFVFLRVIRAFVVRLNRIVRSVTRARHAKFGNDALAIREGRHSLVARYSAR